MKTVLSQRKFASGKTYKELRESLKKRGFDVNEATICKYVNGSHAENLKLIEAINEILKEWGY